jgi:hypothetical protein
MHEWGSSLDADPCIRWRLHRQGGILLNTCTSEVYRLNESAMRMWRLLMEGNNPQDVILKIVEETGAESSLIEADLGEFLVSLLSAGVLRFPEAEDDPTGGKRLP